MKKHNEGYVLPFVLVVLVVVCLVAVSLLTASLDNLKRQQASIDRMEAKYEAQGKIEQLITKLEQDIVIVYDSISATDSEDAERQAKEKLSQDIKNTLFGRGEEFFSNYEADDIIKITEITENGYKFSVKVEETPIECELIASVTIVRDDILQLNAGTEVETAQESGEKPFKATYELSVEIAYDSYSISNEEVAK